MTVLEYRATVEPEPVMVRGRRFDVAAALAASGGLLHVDDSQHPDLARALDGHEGLGRPGLISETRELAREGARLERARVRDAERARLERERAEQQAREQAQREQERVEQAKRGAPERERAEQHAREHLRATIDRIQGAERDRQQRKLSLRARRLAARLAAPPVERLTLTPPPTIVYGLQPRIDFEPFVGATTVYPPQLTEDVFEDLFATSWRGVALSDGPAGVWVLNEVNVQNEAHNLVLSIVAVPGSLIGRSRFPVALGARVGVTLGQRGIFTGSFTLTTPGALVGTRRFPVPLGVGGQQLAMSQAGLLPGDADPCLAVTRGGSVVIPYVAALNSAQFTYEARFCANLTAPGTQTVMSTVAGGRGMSWGTVGWELFATLWNGATATTVTSTGAGLTASPAHGAVTYDGVTVRLYANGSWVGGGTMSGYAPQTASSLTWGSGPGGPFDGRLHATAAYDNTLTLVRVAAHAAAFPSTSAAQGTPVEIGLAAFPTLLRRVA